MNGETNYKEGGAKKKLRDCEGGTGCLFLGHGVQRYIGEKSGTRNTY